MNFQYTILSRFALVVIACISLLLGGCNPALYKQPAQDFHAASVSLEQAYFLELDVSNKARIKRADLDDQIAIWSAPQQAIDRKFVERVSRKMIERREKDIHQGITPFRKKAFAALEGYASVLVKLASDVETEAIVTEVSGLAQDINSVLEMVDTLSTGSELISQYAGPLQQYVQVLNEVIRLVSNVVREQAIMQTIGASNDSLLEILAILKSEAVAARKNSLDQTILARGELESFLEKDGFENLTNVSKSDVARRIAELKILEGKLANDDIAGVFDAAVKAQGALVRKALLSDPQDWAVQIRTFRETVIFTRNTIEKIRSDI